MYGSGTDPMPYIIGAYMCGVLFLIGSIAWVIYQRKNLRKKLEALETEK